MILFFKFCTTKCFFMKKFSKFWDGLFFPKHRGDPYSWKIFQMDHFGRIWSKLAEWPKCKLITTPYRIGNWNVSLKKLVPLIFSEWHHCPPSETGLKWACPGMPLSPFKGGKAFNPHIAWGKTFSTPLSRRPLERFKWMNV